jgi:2-amino-4-hydroxy-6-hydroxymethyldihydropteridine diphosphokinase
MASTSTAFLYVIALGSNRCHGRHGRPETVLAAALTAMEAAGLEIIAAAPPVASAPIGPSLRTYANAACQIRSQLAPPALLASLKKIEQAFGRRRGQRWGSRVLDLDIILWSGGCWRSRKLTIPHAHWRERAFVALPLADLAPDWRAPKSHQHVRHVAAHLRRPRPLSRLTSPASPPRGMPTARRHER